MKPLTIILLLIVITFQTSCDSFFCSKEKPSAEELTKLKIAQSYFSEYKISFDNCLPLGYINVYENKRTSNIDTLAINIINDSLINLGFNQRWIQVYDGFGSWRYQQRKYSTEFHSSYVRLRASDL